LTKLEEFGYGEIVTLCGSTKFKEAYEEWNRKLTLHGCLVFSCGLFGHADGIELTADQKAGLDILHLKKINKSDSILVLNVDGYVGESTFREIEFAHWMGKQVHYLNTEAALKLKCHMMRIGAKLRKVGR
jgi:hypothetical protein